MVPDAKNASANASAKPAAANVLDMPLATGGSVQATVPINPVRLPTKSNARPNTQRPTPARMSGMAAPAAANAGNVQADADEAAQAELEYAARMMRQAKQEANTGRFIPQAASQARYVPSIKPTASKQVFNPNEYRPGVDWKPTNSTHFTIYTQQTKDGIGSSNMGMLFESAYATLQRNIPWMMSDKVRVFVYKDHNNYLKYEPNAKAWTRALAYPTRGEIVVYDEPGKQQELKEVFTHELVHIFTQKFFDKHQSGRLMTPTWLDEGLAVYMEDQAYNGSKGGPWGNDLKTLNIQRNPKSQAANFSSSSRFNSNRAMGSNLARKGPPLFFMPFEEFMQEGSLSNMESKNKTQDWYLQAYAMVRFLMTSNNMQFRQFTNLIANGEQVRDPSSGFPVKGADGKPMYRPYSVEKAMGQSYRYNNASNFEDAFWRWMNNPR